MSGAIIKAQNKISSFQKIAKSLKPYCATVIGGSFDPFNSYYLRLLWWASKQSKPLIVIVHTDRIIALRRGFIPPSENQTHRARHIASLDFVDHVVISQKVAHDPVLLRLLKPKFVVFQHDNVSYLKKISDEVLHRFPRTKSIIAPLERDVAMPARSKNQLPKVGKNKICRKLILLTRISKARIGKISALIVRGNKIVACAVNSEEGEHAEIILLKKGMPGDDLSDCSLYVLIPPCLMCAEVILQKNIKRVYYLFQYGGLNGITYLKNKGVMVKRYHCE